MKKRSLSQLKKDIRDAEKRKQKALKRIHNIRVKIERIKKQASKETGIPLENIEMAYRLVREALELPVKKRRKKS